MENNQTLYIKTDDNKIINERCIKWVKMGDCLEVCTKSIGCIVKEDTHRICILSRHKCFDKFSVN